MSEKKQLEFEVYFRKPGSSISRQLRKKQLIPAIVYGPGQKSIALSLDIRSVEKYAKKEYENKIFTFKSDEKDLNGLKVLKKEISYDKVTRNPLHIDFFSLDMAKVVRVNVEVYFTGKSKGVKESGGVFNIIRRTVEVECFPSEIPESFSIDISPLDINQNFHVSDLKVPKNIKLITSPKASLCMVSEIAEEESKVAEADGSAPVVSGSAEGTAKDGKKEDSAAKK
ncbi:MAG: 50S ribosomal protein L25 [Bdellovibrionales bacterium]|nr:50S ribosomal protein L25 [Bdellovibrionales bacterium]